MIGGAKDAVKELDCFSLFMDSTVIRDITERTNSNITKHLDRLTADQKKKYSYVRTTTEEEISAYLGLMYLRGAYQWNYWDIQRVWTSHPVFPAAMAINRFWFLNIFLVMDDPETRVERWQTDRFAAVRELFERVNDNCGSALQMGKFGAIDECLYACRNQVAIKQYNKSKPAKYGLLFKCINEVTMPYTHRSEVFAGKPSEPGGGYYYKTVEEITLRLVDKVREQQDLQGRNITFDNLYTSIPLAEKLLDRKITIVGTMRHNRKGLPKEIKSMEGRESNSSIVYWEKKEQKLTLTTYVVSTKSKGLKNIIVLASTPPLLGQTKDDGKCKPGIIKFYDFNKGGTDIVDQRSAQNTTSTKSVKWTKKVLSYMLDISRLNAHCPDHLLPQQWSRS